MELWTDTELDALGSAGELEISSRRDDGTLSPPVTIWAVRHRKPRLRPVSQRARPPPGTARRSAARRRISSGGVERHVRFLGPEGDVEDAIDSAYRDKYGASSSATQRITAPLARDTTIRLTPADPD